MPHAMPRCASAQGGVLFLRPGIAPLLETGLTPRSSGVYARPFSSLSPDAFGARGGFSKSRYSLGSSNCKPLK